MYTILLATICCNATTGVDCLTSLCLRMNLLPSAVNLCLCCRPKTATQPTAQSATCSSPHNAVGIPIAASFHVVSCHCCSSSSIVAAAPGTAKGAYLHLVDVHWNSTHRPVTGCWVLLFIGYLCLCGYY